MFVKDFYEILKKSLVSYRTALTNGGSPDLSGQIDFAKPDDILERRTAAHIIHYILLNILKETDEQDITMAFELKDIYECKVCLQHIAQVYLKGIMPADGNTFGVRNLVNEVEAKEIACRIFDKASRIRPEVDMPKGSVSVLTEEGLKKLIKECNPLILDIDKISTAEESAALLNNINILEKDFETKIKVIDIPMTQIIRNPYCIRNYIENIVKPGTNDLAYPVVILSRSAECAQTTGECLVQAGYRNVWMGYFDPVFMQKIWGKRVNESKSFLLEIS